MTTREQGQTLLEAILRDHIARLEIEISHVIDSTITGLSAVEKFFYLRRLYGEHCFHLDRIGRLLREFFSFQVDNNTLLHAYNDYAHDRPMTIQGIMLSEKVTIIDAPKPFPALSLDKIMQTTKLLPADTIQTERVRCFCGQWECKDYQEHQQALQEYNLPKKIEFSFSRFEFRMQKNFVNHCYKCGKWLCDARKKVLYLYVNIYKAYLAFFCSYKCFRRYNTFQDAPMEFEKTAEFSAELSVNIRQEIIDSPNNNAFLFAIRPPNCRTSILFSNFIEIFVRICFHVPI